MKEPEKIKLPKELQVKMLEFFLKTSIPKKKALLSENEKKKEGKTDENGNLREGID